MARLMQGFVQIYTGNGKGKTTAAFGAALRAAGNGFSVAFIQFLKPGTDAQLFAHLPAVHFRAFGRSHTEAGWYHKRLENELPPREIEEGWAFASETILTSTHDVVIIDELNVALLFDFISVESVIEVLQKRPKNREVIITGRGAPQSLIDLADLVTEMREIKHMYQRGVAARLGIEF
ncbi:MAG: Cob(I)alamin adenosyltransferase [candidate division TM6 bacterium GW2011_GWF2_43_87]|nr:MAG: Cob(I)alamin adenosyltransferase [candidate division TM6 bacterium GW2011_GWF2_43_87]